MISQASRSLAARATTHEVPSSSHQTIDRLIHSLQVIQPKVCREVGTAIGRGSLHITRTIRMRHGRLTSREISYPSYQVARRHLDPRQYSCATLYHADPLLIDMQIYHHESIQWCFVDCDARSYLSITELLLPVMDESCLVIYDDMHTADDKCPDLVSRLDAHQRYTYRVASEPGDELLLASRDRMIFSRLQLHPTD